MPSSSAKPKANFEVVFSGQGILPWKIPLRAVTDALTAVQRLASGEESADRDDREESGLVRLLEVKKGSAVFRCVTPVAEIAHDHLREAGQMIADPLSIGERGYVLRPIRTLSRIAGSLGCSIQVREDKDSAPLVRIVAESFDGIKDKVLIDMETEITGVVERVGGVTARRCSLRVPFQQHILYCGVGSEKTIRKLGQQLHENVIVSGRASILKGSWKILKFTIRDVRKHSLGNLQEALDELWNAGAKAWQKVEDPDSYIKNLRGNAS